MSQEPFPQPPAGPPPWPPPQQPTTPPVRPHETAWRVAKVASPIIVGLATIASLVVAWIQLQEQLHQIEEQTRQPPGYTARVDTPAEVDALVDFASANDYQVRRIDLECLSGQGEKSCLLAPRAFTGEDETVLFVSSTKGCALSYTDTDVVNGFDCVTHWVHLSKEDDFDAQIDNGEFGAGSLVVHGYFAVSSRQALGSAPPQVRHIFLRAVAPELAAPR